MGKQVKEGKKSPFRGQPVKVLRLANLSTSIPAQPVLCPKGVEQTKGSTGGFDSQTDLAGFPLAVINLSLLFVLKT